MLEGWANDAVILLAGVVFGSLLSVANLLVPQPSATEMRKQPGERFWEWQSRRRQEQDARLENAPRSYTLVSVAFFGFLVAFIVAVVASPLQMRWWYFLGGSGAAFALGTALPKLVEAGKIPAAPDESLITVLLHSFFRSHSSEEPPAPTASL